MAVRRPLIHLSDVDRFINDPNGLIVRDGVAHAFYQRGDHQKSWGHAVSRDFCHWEPRPVALEADELGDCWSGSCVEAGGRLAAFFTSHQPYSQVQSLAFSDDEGETWDRHPGNPILADADAPDFRDPNVFRHEESGRWIMVLSGGRTIRIYASADLISWTRLPDVEVARPSQETVWECPDLVRVPVEGGGERWMLVASLMEPVFTPGRALGMSGVIGYPGTFDGERFIANVPAQPIRIAEGPDEYATVTFAGTPGRVIAMGWLANWRDAGTYPSDTWRHTLGLPREWTFSADGRLLQRFVSEADTVFLPSEEAAWAGRTTIEPGSVNEVCWGSEVRLGLDWDAGRWTLEREIGVCEGPLPFGPIVAIHDTVSLELIMNGESVVSAQTFFGDAVLPSAGSFEAYSPLSNPNEIGTMGE